MADFFNLSRFNLISGEISVKNTPVTFDGIPIGLVVPYANVLDIRIGAPKIETTTIVPGISSGLLFSRNRFSSRVIEVEIELPLDKESFPENVRAIRAWAASSEPKRLIISAYKDKYIMAICTNLNDISLKQYWKPIVVKFECMEAYFVSISPFSAQIGSPFSIQGDAEPDVLISYSLGTAGKLNSPQWQFDSDRILKLNTTVTGGNVLIDLKRQSIYRGDISLMQYVTLSSRFPALKPGQHTITGPAGGTITWHERWL